MNVMKYVLILFLLNGNNGHIQYSLLLFYVHILRISCPLEFSPSHDQTSYFKSDPEDTDFSCVFDAC